MSAFTYSCLFTGSQSVHSAALPEDTSYLLLEDLQHNQTHSLTQSNTHSVKHTLTDARLQVETHIEALPPADTQLEAHPDLHATIDIHRETDMQSHSDSHSHTAVLVKLQQVSEVQAVNTERYENRCGIDI